MPLVHKLLSMARTDAHAKSAARNLEGLCSRIGSGIAILLQAGEVLELYIYVCLLISEIYDNLG